MVIRTTLLLFVCLFCHFCLWEGCNAPLQRGHILAHFKVEVIKQPSDNNFDKIFAKIQVGLNNNPWPNAHIHDYNLPCLC
jgi:hypothetical protein